MTQQLISGVKNYMNPASFGVQNPNPGSGSGLQSWSFETLTALPSEDLLDRLTSISGRLASKTLDVQAVLPALVKLCASNNAQVKAAVCAVIVDLVDDRAADPEVAGVGLLIVNVLSKDLNDPNPEIRATAVTTICAISNVTDAYALKGSNCRYHVSLPLCVVTIM